MMWGWDGGMSWLGWLWMGVIGIAVLATLITVVALTVRAGRPPDAAMGGAPGTAEALLAERFARGEIDEQEYLQRRAVLRGAR